MTVCVSVKVHDCLVFAADSASSLVGTDAAGQPKVYNVYDHGNKVFNLYKGKPIAAMTCGMGHIGSASIGNLAKDFRRIITTGIGGNAIDPDNYTIEELAIRAKEFFGQRFTAIQPPPANPNLLEFWVGGYGSNCDNAELWKLTLQNSVMLDPELVADKDQDGHIAWGGQPQAIDRLILGYDRAMGDALIAAGLPQATVEPLLDQVRQRLQTPLVHSAMPVQDAINLADFMVDLTKRYFRFLPEADIVGGATDIATVTKHEGFKWIRRKHYYPVELNPTETDHV
ncbi:hypothetical protein [Sphingobium subterraneum]|uniref:Uncharacterized protein n=1 Tax=Sphingobium subterraneum TaxID=627688 RepID=A0A841J139_9SPHN|nr:hypothetical protein [Sphingobium subterraneum]MBB6124062.1 hypothetical protein [Sphingobium subterraneum]